MAPELLPERLDDLVRARIATRTTAPTAPALASELAPFAPTLAASRRWESEIDDALERTGPRVGDEVQRELATRFGGGKLQWQPLVTRTIPALALGVAADDKRAIARLAKREDWAAAVTARALGLWHDGPPPRLAAVCDALVWRGLGLAGKPKRTPPEVRSHFVHEILTAGSGPPERLLPLLAARELGIVRADLRALREALVRRWLCGQAWHATGAATVSPATTIGDFASAVRDSAAHATDGVFGGRKVFISSLWKGMRAHPAFGALTLDEFKAQLLAAHKAGLLALARADLTAAMDPSAVRESETSHLEARYHFVERGGLS
ncbi:MAG TPA: hypothetical protein VM261_27400 [Kofleriaceae bacterium]|nr:hypothetical protein [Kofleriaceae bacterium]